MTNNLEARAIELNSRSHLEDALCVLARVLGRCRGGCAALCMSAIICSATAQAAIISQYDFTGDSLNRAATTVAANVVAGDVTDAPMVNNNPTVVLSRTTGVGYTSEPSLSIARANFNESSVAENVYFTLDVAPQTGYELDLSTLTFNAARGGGATPRTYDVRTSLDGFAASLTGAVELLTARPTFTPVSIDLSGSQFQNITSPLTFQVRIMTPTVLQNVDFDDITINGEVAIAVPEPAAISLLSIVGIAMIGRRRR